MPATISAMTLGWRSGRSMRARRRLRRRMRSAWRMRSGKAKWSGSSPCHTPLDDVFTLAISASVTADIVLAPLTR
uniref:Uncharacterized protein n=1 Tax=Oryza brachyantha TaxID=4533 RepID=J3M3C2_ORYBR